MWRLNGAVQRFVDQLSYGQPKGKNTDKDYRAHMMLETLNSLQIEPQRVDLLVVHHAQFSFTACVRAGSSAFIAWHNAFNDQAGTYNRGNSYITGARDVWHLLHQSPRVHVPMVNKCHAS